MSGNVLINLATGLDDPERLTAEFLVGCESLKQPWARKQ
jgi:hypothetical protein